MTLSSLLARSLSVVFAVWLRILSLWLRPSSSPPSQNLAREAWGSIGITASASASTFSDALIPPSESGCASLCADSGLEGDPGTLSTPCHPPTPRKPPFHWSAHVSPSLRRMFSSGTSCSGSSRTSFDTESSPTPTTDHLPSEGIDPPLIFSFDDELGDAEVDLESGLGIRMEHSLSRSNSTFLASSASIFTKLDVTCLLSASRPTTPCLIPVLSPSRAKSTLQPLPPSLTSEPLVKESPSFFQSSASYTATYSGSPEADLRLEAFHLYDFSPYQQSCPTSSSSLPQSARPCNHDIVLSDNIQGLLHPHPVQPSGNPRLRPLFLPKELATRQAAHIVPQEQDFAPRPLLLPQQAARRSLDLCLVPSREAAFQPLLPTNLADIGETGTVTSDPFMVVESIPEHCTHLITVANKQPTLTLHPRRTY